VIFVHDAEQEAVARAVLARVDEAADRPVQTAIEPFEHFYLAEDYHQQYLAKNPFGYCGLGGTGVACPIATGAKLQKTPA